MREMEDILTRRTKDFDRSNMAGDQFGNIIREGTIGMESHERFKAQRKLWAGTMNTEFLYTVAAPYVYETTSTLVQLWKRKAELAHDHPFEASEDLRFEGFDGIWAFSVGKDLGCTKAQLQHLQSTDAENLSIPQTTNQPVEFPKGDPPALYTAISTITGSLEEIVTSWIPALKWWWITQRPSFKRQMRRKESDMDALISDARARFESKQSAHVDETIATSAMDQVLRRLHNSKITTLTTNLKEPDRHLKDELFLFLLAGYETTAVALSWGVKLFAKHPDVQSRAREHLRAAFGENKQPTVQEILNSHMPYLDALIAEILRCSNMVGGVMRQAQCDTSVLGYPVPKGTLMVMSYGPAYLHDGESPQGEDSKRSQSSKQFGGARGQKYTWPIEGRKDFRPERWLRTQTTKNTQGEEVEEQVCDEHAGPSTPFSMGPRGCFGRRLAMLKLRIAITMMLLNLEFLSISGKGIDEEGNEFDLDSWGGREKLVRIPKHCYVRLQAL